MSILVPSAKTAIISGVGFSCVMWSTLSHIDAIPLVGRFITKDKIFNWCNKNKILTVSLLELLNYSIHGLKSSLGTAMALGSTLVNLCTLFIYIPLDRKRAMNKVKSLN